MTAKGNDREASRRAAQIHGKTCRWKCGFVSHAATSKARFKSERYHALTVCRLRPTTNWNPAVE